MIDHMIMQDMAGLDGCIFSGTTERRQKIATSKTHNEPGKKPLFVTNGFDQWK